MQYIMLKESRSEEVPLGMLCSYPVNKWNWVSTHSYKTTCVYWYTREFLGQENVNKPGKWDISVSFECRIRNHKKMVDTDSRLFVKSENKNVCPDECSHLKMCHVCILGRKSGSACFNLEGDNVESLQN